MWMRNGLVAFGLAAAVSGTAMAGEEKPVKLGEIPADVMEVAKAGLANLKLASADPASVVVDVDDDSMVLAYEVLGEVELVSANTETEADGSYVYEIQGTVTDGRRVEIDIEPDGDVEEIEIEFKIEDVPGAVMNAIQEKLPEFQPDFIEASHSPSMHVIGYEFVGNVGDNKMDIEVSADGMTITVADQ